MSVALKRIVARRDEGSPEVTVQRVAETVAQGLPVTITQEAGIFMIEKGSLPRWCIGNIVIEEGMLYVSLQVREESKDDSFRFFLDSVALLRREFNIKSCFCDDDYFKVSK